MDLDKHVVITLNGQLIADFISLFNYLINNSFSYNSSTYQLAELEAKNITIDDIKHEIHNRN